MQGKTILSSLFPIWEYDEEFTFRTAKDKRSKALKALCKKASRKFRKGNKININNIEK